jgi:deoxycytidine triphosphate deaminase
MVEKQKPLFDERLQASGILIDKEIQESVEDGFLIARNTFDGNSVEASSYDIRVGRKGILGGQGAEIDLTKDPLELAPGAYAGVISLECLRLPDHLCARIGSKRALSYDGVILLTGALVDPGYEGHLLFGLYNASQKKVIIRHGRKLCNVVFERLAIPPTGKAPIDPNLRGGSFPDAFVDRMANMDVLTWMQISERVKQIEDITKDIIDLKARYEDVLQPIRDLTKNVESLTKDISSLTLQTRNIADDLANVNNIVSENSKQITQLTANVASVTGSVQFIGERTRGIEKTVEGHGNRLTEVRTDVGRFKFVAYVFWAIVLLAAGAILPEVVKRLFA